MSFSSIKSLIKTKSIDEIGWIMIVASGLAPYEGRECMSNQEPVGTPFK